MNDKTEYHVSDTCNKCGGPNNVNEKSTDGLLMCEAKTECKKCGHKDYWAYGFFESSDRMVSKCKKYINNKGVLEVVK